MSQTLNHDNSITVVGYSLPEFCFELTELGAKGYTVSYENDKLPFGGMGSIYQCTVVPRHGYHIDKDGNHVNTPKYDQQQVCWYYLIMLFRKVFVLVSNLLVPKSFHEHFDERCYCQFLD